MTNWFLKTALSLVDLVIPQSKQVERLLRLSPFEMKRRLPKPRPIEAKDVEALFDYRDDRVRTMIHEAKYRANISIIKRIANFLNDEITHFASDFALFEGGEKYKLIVVPVPSSRKARIERGWSQCELVCKELGKICGKNMEIRLDWLTKVVETKKQTTLSRQERLINVKNSMLSRPIDKQYSVIVIDDVYTTGATYREAKRALLEAGAHQVFGFFVAH